MLAWIQCCVGIGEQRWHPLLATAIEVEGETHKLADLFFIVQIDLVDFEGSRQLKAFSGVGNMRDISANYNCIRGIPVNAE
jgi:hypothetical protein